MSRPVRWTHSVRVAGAASALIVAMVVTACRPAAAPTPPPDLTPVDQSEDALSPVLANSEFLVGENRFLFGLLDNQNQLVDDADVTLAFFYLGDDPDNATEEGEAEAQPLEVGLEGLEETLGEPVPALYVAHFAFDQPGRWGVEFRAQRPAGEPQVRRQAFQVVEESVAPDVGDPAIPSQNRTGANAAELSQITSDFNPDPDLYRTTIATAITSGRPIVISFSTPAFCTSRTCGPSLEVVKVAKDRFGEQVHFIHVEIYQDFSTQTVDPVVLEWNLPSEPWVYVVDGEGIVSARFEGLVGLGELTGAIEEVLGR